MRAGLGVDRVEDVTAMTFDDGIAGTILCIETFEHVWEIHKAFDEVYRALAPGGMFVITSPFHFKIHGYPDDYWRMTPSCLRRHMEVYEARICGAQGHFKTPHTVMAIGFKAPAPADFDARARNFVAAYQSWLKEAEASLPFRQKVKRVAGALYRSKAERYQITDYYKAELAVEHEFSLASAT